MHESEVNILAETEMYGVIETRTAEGETIYHLEMGTVTLHFFPEEWNEFVALMQQVISK